MQTFRHRARLILAVLAAAVSTGALATSPALAGPAHAAGSAETWTVKPGGSINGNSGEALLEDTTTGSTVTCASSTTAGMLKKGSGLAGTAIGSLTSVTYTSCAGPGGLAFAITASASSASPWQLNVKSYNATSGVTSGTITNVEATLSASGCGAAVDGPAAATPGTAKITYANGKHDLRFPSRGGTLHFWDVSGCGGLFSDGDAAQLDVCYKITPPQTITPTTPGPRPYTTGTGPPC